MNMTIPETIWEHTKENEIQRMVLVARMIRSYFYQKKGFQVLPKIATKSVNTIYFPNLPIVHHQYFWECIQDNVFWDQQLPEPLYKEIYAQLPDTIAPTIQQIEWEKIAPHFWKTIQQFLPEVYSKLSKVIIRQTAIGSLASGIRRTKEESGTITVYLRFDADISHIASAIFIASLDHTRKDGLLYGYSWEERQSVGDFLLTHTSLAELFPNHESTMKAVRSNISESLTRDTKLYLTELGYPPKKLFSVNDQQQILVNEEPLHLRPQEQHIMELLIEKRNQIVSTNSLATKLWEKESNKKYSLYAISKVVERLRKQIQAIGIYPGVIETRRGLGFVLND